MTPATDADLPETVPARQLNEFVYCPRLFYLEWVQRRWASSDDVEEGMYVHRVVDHETGLLPPPDQTVACAGRQVRSVWLTSAELGVSAKLDLVEVLEGGEVMPVDYKKGGPKPDGTMWETDRTQVMLQALLLHEIGYRVSRAGVWYDEVRRRVDVPVGDGDRAEAAHLVQSARAVASQDHPPLPLVDSPKCPRCSLVGICLPDEITSARERRVIRRRSRIVPLDPAHRPVYVQEQGSVVGIKGERLEVRKDRALLASYRLIDVAQLNLQGNVSLSAYTMRALRARSIPVCWFSYGGWFSGIALGLPSGYVDVRRAQFTATPEVTLGAARRMISGKIRNSRTLLRRNSRGDCSRIIEQLGRLTASALDADSFPRLLGIEGTAARLYFSGFTSMLGPAVSDLAERFAENGRGRRPPPDPVNALLSFAYSLIVKDLTCITHAVGLDPYLGVLHRPRFGRPALALDLAEEFRPLVAESTVLQVLNNGEVAPSDFTVRATGCQLDDAGRRAFLAAYERRLGHEITHPVFGYKVTYRRAMDVQTRLLAAYLTGEVDEYVPFMTR